MNAAVHAEPHAEAAPAVTCEKIEGCDAVSGCSPLNAEDPRNTAAVGVLERAWAWLNAYFAGQAPRWTPPLHIEGTEFQHAIWVALLEILMARRSPMANWPIGWRVAAGSRKRGWKRCRKDALSACRWCGSGPKSHLDHRALPSRGGCGRIAHRIRRWRGAQTRPARARGGAVTEAFDNLAYACRQPPHVSTTSARVYFRGGFSAYSCENAARVTFRGSLGFGMK